MNLLVFYPYVPYPLNRGTYQRTFHLLRELARACEVDFFALDENGEGAQYAPLFEEFCHRVKVVPFRHPEWDRLFPNRLLNPLPQSIAHWSIPGVAAELRNFLAGRKYDAVHACDIVLAQFFLNEHRDLP